MKKLMIKAFCDTIQVDYDEHLVKGSKVYYLKNDEIVAVLEETEIDEPEEDDIDEEQIDKIQGGVIVNEV